MQFSSATSRRVPNAPERVSPRGITVGKAVQAAAERGITPSLILPRSCAIGYPPHPEFSPGWVGDGAAPPHVSPARRSVHVRVEELNVLRPPREGHPVFKVAVVESDRARGPDELRCDFTAFRSAPVRDQTSDGSYFAVIRTVLVTVLARLLTLPGGRRAAAGLRMPLLHQILLHRPSLSVCLESNSGSFFRFLRCSRRSLSISTMTPGLGFMIHYLVTMPLSAPYLGRRPIQRQLGWDVTWRDLLTILDSA